MEKLISMVAFVKEQINQYDCKVNKDTEYNDLFELKNKIENYASFLSEPLQLWMFVPCDENNAPLEEPINIFSDSPIKEESKMYQNSEPVKKYQQAKERCYFEGEHGLMDGWCLQLDGGYLITASDRLHEMTIEDLIPYNLTLAQTAKNRIL